MQTRPPLVILGTGYTGRWLYRLARAEGLTVLAGSRRPEQHLAAIEPAARLRFDLDDPESWRSVPPGADLIWTFPALPLTQVQACAQYVMRPARRVVVLGSTSAYHIAPTMTDDPPRWLDETSPINDAQPRVQGEEYLRTRHGAIILRVAGIYGPQRDPVEWIRQGRVGPSGKFVNLIHVEDLAQICLSALSRGRAGESYNVSDGRPRRWAEICAEVAARWSVVSPKSSDAADVGKRIVNRKLVEELAPIFRHPDLYVALQDLERTSTGNAS